MKKFAIAALAMFIAAPALAQQDPYSRNDPNPGFVDKGIQTYNPQLNAMERVGVTCSLYLDNVRIHEGYCKVGRRDSVTLISTGSDVYKIVRDNPNRARFFKGVNSNIAYGVVTTQGNCWSSARVQFCAD